MPNTTPEMISAEEIAALPTCGKVHDLNTNAVRSAKFLSAQAGMKHLDFLLMTLQPRREASEFHRHLYEEECYYILSGEGRMRIGDEWHAVQAGDFVGFKAAGRPHVLLNTGHAPLVFLMARTKLELDVCDYPDKGKRLYMNGDEEAFVEFDAIIRG